MGKTSDEMVESTLEASKAVTEFTRLSSGALIKAKEIPDNLILLLKRQNPSPKPPIVAIESGGKKWKEANPNDPVYIEESEQYEIEMGNAMMDLMLLAGMEIIELPKGVAPFEADGSWAEELEAAGIKIPESEAARRLMWTRYKIMPSSIDLAALSEAYARTAGISEEDIAAKEATFRRSARRRARQRVADEEIGSDV